MASSPSTPKFADSPKPVERPVSRSRRFSDTPRLETPKEERSQRRQASLSFDAPNAKEEVCRLCEERIPADQFETHSIFCLIGNQCAIRITKIDEELFDVGDELSIAIYAASMYYLKGFVKTLSEVTGDHIVLSDMEFEFARDLNKKLNQVVRIHDFSFSSIESLENLANEVQVLCTTHYDTLQKPVQELADRMKAATFNKLAQFRSSYGACKALVDDSNTLESNEFLQVAKKSFLLRYSDVMPELEDFDMIKPISKGAFGQVFLAKKKRTGDYFAIKVQKKNSVFRKKISKRVNDEHAILASTTNPFIVKLYYSFQSEDNLFLVMEYLPGGDCLSLLENLGCFSEQMTRIYIAETILALKYLHSFGIIHRDLKPDNMLISADGHIKLTDFGLSVYGIHSYFQPSVASSDLRDSTDPTDLSRSGIHSPNDPIPLASRPLTRREKSFSCVGTPDYLAPEVLQGKGHDSAADWWSLGVIAYEFLCGFTPFGADSPEQVFDQILHLPLEWPEDCDASPEAKDLVEGLLQRDPEERLGVKGEGVHELMSHPFFKDIHWDSLLSQPPVFTPRTKHLEDTAYFDSRSEAHKSVEVNLETLYPSSIQNIKGSPIQRGSPGSGKVHRRRDFPTFQFRNLSHLAEANTSIFRERTQSKKNLDLSLKSHSSSF